MVIVISLIFMCLVKDSLTQIVNTYEKFSLITATVEFFTSSPTLARFLDKGGGANFSGFADRTTDLESVFE